MINAKLAEASAAAAARRRAEDLATQASAAPADDALARMADPTGTVTFNTTDWFGREDQVPGLGASPDVMKAIFAAPAGK